MQPCHYLLASAGLIHSLIHLNQNPSIHMKNHTETPRCLTGMNFGISVVSDIHKLHMETLYLLVITYLTNQLDFYM